MSRVRDAWTQVSGALRVGRIMVARDASSNGCGLGPRQAFHVGLTLLLKTVDALPGGDRVLVRRHRLHVLGVDPTRLTADLCVRNVYVRSKRETIPEVRAEISDLFGRKVGRRFAAPVYLYDRSPVIEQAGRKE